MKFADLLGADKLASKREQEKQVRTKKIHVKFVDLLLGADKLASKREQKKK
jgi:hypothetical protein